MKERKNVTWRVAEHSENEKINKWLDQQKNIQDSIANIVLHMIDQFGYVNITDYQVQKQLYNQETDYKEEAEADPKEDEGEKVAESAPNPAKEEETENKERKKSKDDFFDEVDPNNL